LIPNCFRFDPFRAAVLLSLVAGLVAGARSTVAAPAARAPATLVSADNRSVRFRVDIASPTFAPSRALSGFETIRIDGFGLTGEAGQPPVASRQFLVAIPTDASFTVTARALTSQSFGAHRLEPMPHVVPIEDDEMGKLPGEKVTFDESVYRGAAVTPLVRAGEAAYIRRQRVVPVHVNPLVYDPGTGEVSVATSIEVEVRLSGGARRSDATGVPAGAETQAWENLFGRMVVNPEQGRSWRAPRTTLSPATSMQTFGTAQVAPGAVKLPVRRTGIHRVTASALVTAGFPAGQLVTNLRLFQRTYNETTFTPNATNIPFHVREAAGGTAGVFEGNDQLIFYGLRLSDDSDSGDLQEQYAAYNVYWLDTGTGVEMASRTPGVGFVTADTTNASFPVTEHFEEDRTFWDFVPPAGVDVYWFNQGYEPGPVDYPFTLNAIKPGTSLGLTVQLLGQEYTGLRLARISLANSLGESLLNAGFAVNNKTLRNFTATIPAASFAVGTNNVRLARPDNSRNIVGVLMNHVDVTYQSLYRARGDGLRFNSGSLAGDTTITVTGLGTSNNLELFDITSPNGPERVLISPAHFQAGDGSTVLAFRENFPARREYLLVPSSRMIDIPASDIMQDTPSSIIGSPAQNGTDVLVVSHATFVSQMQSWASYRRAQGYRVYMVDVEDVYDEFSNGVPMPLAVFRFTRHFYELGNAGALVLVGDGSEDGKHVHADSGPNFIPVYFRLDAVPQVLTDEVTPIDKPYVKMRAPNGSVDPFPDLIFGRIPVGSTGELQIYLDKVIAYEKPTASDFWRKRMIFVADDTYSAATGGNCENLGEIGFKQGQENDAQRVEQSLPAGYDVVRFYLDDYTAAIHTTNCIGTFASIRYTRQNATELLMSELNQGATMVSIQAHINRSSVCHERLLATLDASLLDSPGRDHLRADNRDKPWIMFGMGCHFSDFAITQELSSNWLSSNAPNGDVFGEQYLFQRERGAVATYGSTGFEYLQPNVFYMEYVTKVWFYEAPYDTMINQTQGEWKLGELMFLSEAQLAGGQPGPVERYEILGDPLLRIDAGPPSFNVTVDGNPVTTNEIVESGGEGDTLQVVAIVTDENVIRNFELEIDGIDLSDSLTVTPLVDQALPRSRQYRVSFRHKLKSDNYDIILRAYQAPDTIAGQYHIAAEFKLRVESSISVSVNGRAVTSGSSVPADGKYRVELTLPVYVESDQISVRIDDQPVLVNYSHPSPEDSLTWILNFREQLGPGQHEMVVTAGANSFIYVLLVSDTPGLRNVVNYPNPFKEAGTSIVYSNESEILKGTIDIFTVSGKRVRRLDIPSSARFPGENSVFWDGRDSGGNAIANGVYLYVVKVEQRGGEALVRGKMARIQ